MSDSTKGQVLLKDQSVTKISLSLIQEDESWVFEWGQNRLVLPTKIAMEIAGKIDSQSSFNDGVEACAMQIQTYVDKQPNGVLREIPRLLRNLKRE
jgi:hypothetical protein